MNECQRKQTIIISELPTFAVLTTHQVDTLNKNEFEEGTYKTKFNKWQVMFCESTLNSGSLIIIVYPGVAQNSSLYITHLIVGSKVQSEYHEWHDYDTTFRTNLQQEKSNTLTLPITLNKCILSDTNFLVGKIIYGFADILTNTYYQDTENFKTGYIAQRLHFRYYFKLTVKKKPTNI